MENVSKANFRRMSQIRSMLGRERNSPRPNQAKIDALMTEHKELETAEHVRMVFGDRGIAGAIKTA
jgi:hypothetical protein